MKQIRIQLETITAHPITRSEAREVLLGMDAFDTIIFDFEHISELGQAFADEVFRVFHHTHPEIKLEVENISERVKFMVERAQNEAANKLYGG